jgi:hypothetical protein
MGPTPEPGARSPHADIPVIEAAAHGAQRCPVPRPTPRAASVFGWYGTLAILVAYAGISLGWLERGLLYQLLNLTGAAGVGLVCWYQRTWQAFWLEVAWVAVALVGIITSLWQ